MDCEPKREDYVKNMIMISKEHLLQPDEIVDNKEYWINQLEYYVRESCKLEIENKIKKLLKNS